MANNKTSTGEDTSKIPVSEEQLDRLEKAGKFFSRMIISAVIISIVALSIAVLLLTL